MNYLKHTLRILLLFTIYLLTINSVCQNGGGPSDPTAGLYHTYEEIDQELHALAAGHPDIAEVTSIGQSLEGRELWIIKISVFAGRMVLCRSCVFMPVNSLVG